METEGITAYLNSLVEKCGTLLFEAYRQNAYQKLNIYLSRRKQLRNRNNRKRIYKLKTCLLVGFFITMTFKI